MFWNDIKEMQSELVVIRHKLHNICISLDNLKNDKKDDEFDKFDDYMKNVDKLNSMVNEFKGCVALARSAIEERKELDKQSEETKKLSQISQDIYKSMLSFIKAGENIKHEAYFKIDYIYKYISSLEEKKSPKKKKVVKKRVAFPAS
jgi:transcription initiation factor TFIIIB Brf1 subunit/transcription initiation factor TFIIB